MNKIFCQYSDIFGKPRTGAHSYRVGDIAVVDTVFAIILMIVLVWLFNSLMPIPLVILSGILAHRLFCVKTKVDVMLFGE